jgi:kynurenine formamidase
MKIKFTGNLLLIMALSFIALAHPQTCEAWQSVSFEDVAAGRAEIIDLTWPLNAKNGYWPGGGYKPFELRTIATLEKDGVLSKAFSMPEHLGTHIDAPNHFEPNQPSVSEIDPKLLIGPGVVIDISPRAEQDADTMLTQRDIAAWEKEHGEIPSGAVVLLNTGWGRHWKSYVRYKNQDARGGLHFPGFSGESAKWLVENRKIRGIGIDTLSIDRGQSKKFEVHHIVNGAGRYGIENVAHLEKLPPRGFHLIVAPIRIEEGSGGPCRILAIVPRLKQGAQAEQ